MAPKIISLDDAQEVWFKRSKRILKQQGAYLDDSPPGYGKTLIPLAHALDMDKPLFVLCPASAISVWQWHVEHYGVEATILSYDSLTSGNQGKIYFKGNFVARASLKKALRGRFVVFDEVHTALNRDTLRNKMMLSVTRVCRELGCEMAFLSATPGHSGQHALAMMCFLGLLQKSCTSSSNSEIRQEIEEKIDDPDLRRFGEIVYPKRMKKEELDSYVLVVYNHYVRGNFSGSIEAVYDAYTNSAVYNAFFTGKEKEAREMAKILNDVVDDNARGDAKRTLMLSEIVTTSVIMRHSLKILEKSKKHKIVMFFNFVKTLRAATAAFEKRGYKPLVIDGSTPVNRRAEIIAKFQQHDSEYRVILLNIEASATAISLDDTNGDYPRVAYIMPGFTFNSISHAVYRAIRRTTASPATVYVSYVNTDTSQSDGEPIEDPESFAKQYRVYVRMQEKTQSAVQISDYRSIDLLPSNFPKIAVMADLSSKYIPEPDREDIDTQQSLIEQWLNAEDPEEFLQQTHLEKIKKRAAKMSEVGKNRVEVNKYIKSMAYMKRRQDTQKRRQEDKKGAKPVEERQKILSLKEYLDQYRERVGLDTEEDEKPIRRKRTRAPPSKLVVIDPATRQPRV